LKKYKEVIEYSITKFQNLFASAVTFLLLHIGICVFNACIGNNVKLRYKIKIQKQDLSC